jgi:O-acetyl-ADP-ribose deacetylase (regulator of RNase III)
MITYVKGDLLESGAQALVNTVNTVGVMGKGIALQFRERFPANYKVYSDACKKGQVKIGQMLVVLENSFGGEKLIINFPTKTEWYKKSQYSFIEEGLMALAAEIRDRGVLSVAMPPLGCGNGGLKWEKVKPLIEKYLHDADCLIEVFEPNEHVKEMLKTESSKKVAGLTAPRAMLLYALAKYERRGETPSVFAANKIAYFLQESGEPLKLHFKAYTYGPYDQAVEKVLYALNGKYISGLEQMTAKPFEPLQLNYDNFKEVDDFVSRHLTPVQRERLENVFLLIEGFESSLSLEILSSVHYLLSEDKSLTPAGLLEKIQSWNERKKNLIREEYVMLALKQLDSYSTKLHFA